MNNVIRVTNTQNQNMLSQKQKNDICEVDLENCNVDIGICHVNI